MKKFLCALCLFAAVGMAYAADNTAAPAGQQPVVSGQTDASKDAQPATNPDGAVKDDAKKETPAK